MSKEIMIKPDVNKINELHYQRAERIFRALKPIFATIDAESLAEVKNWPRAMTLFNHISAKRLELSEKYNKSNLFKIITDNNRWRIFNYVFNCATQNADCYKENIVDQPWNLASSKTVYKIVDEFLDAGLFIYIGDWYDEKSDNRKRNLKPTEAAIIEYLDYSISDLKKTIELVKEYTKIKIEFS